VTLLDDPSSPVHRLARRRRTGVAMLIAASVLWSLSGLAVKLAGMNPLAFAMWRSLAGGVALGSRCGSRRGAGRGRSGWCRRSLCYTAVVSLLLAAMTLGTAARGILLQYTGPVFCALLPWLFNGDASGVTRSSHCSSRASASR
jgi:drug/metabolite transporter (DMT)-like permease